MNITMDELGSYYDRLKQHDWFYDYSDDYRVWSEGSMEHSALLGMAKKHPWYEELFRKYANWVYDRTQPKPERPA